MSDVREDQFGDLPKSSKLTKLDDAVAPIASFFAALGGIITGPQITAIVESNEPRWTLLCSGIVLMILGFFVPSCIKLWIARRFEKGASMRFINSVDECVRAMSDYYRSGKGEEARQTLMKKLSSEASHVLGHQARVCLYWKSIKSQEQVTFELICENSGERMPRGRARSSFNPEDPAGKAFISAMDDRTQRIVVQDVSRSSHFLVSANRANGYKSFVLVPILTTGVGVAHRATVGVMTVDFPQRGVITDELETLAAAFGEMFSDVLQDAQDKPFGSLPSGAGNTKSSSIVELIEGEEERHAEGN